MSSSPCIRRTAALLPLLIAAACATPSSALAPDRAYVVPARDAAANLPPITGVAAALLEPLSTVGLRAEPGDLITLESGEERIEQRLVNTSGLALLTLQSTPGGELRLLARANVALGGAALSSAALRSRALLHLAALRLALPRGTPIISSVAERRVVQWERSVNGVPVPGDGTRVIMSASGALVGVAIEESALTPASGKPRSAAEAKAAALALLPAGASLAGAPRLGWVHVGALAGDEELRDTPRRLAWRIRGSLADGKPLEVHLDAAQLTLLGWDWVR
ncbi:MAG: hypothetical protein ACOVKQ_01720 [Candidatus Limnocylindrus sp.]